MTKQFVVGKQYKLVDASKDWATDEVITAGDLKFPANDTFTCSEVDSDGDAWTQDAGVVWVDGSQPNGVMCATADGLRAGAFEEVCHD